MTVLGWEHDQRTISQDRLERISQLYDKPLTWFLTLEEGDLEPPDAGYEVARRIYRRVVGAPRKYHPMLERVVDDLLKGIEAQESAN